MASLQQPVLRPLGDGTSVLVFRPGDFVTFVGAVTLRVVHGDINVMGCLVAGAHHGSMSFPVYSPTTHAPLSMSASNTAIPLGACDHAVVKSLYEDADFKQGIAAVALLTPIDSGSLSHLVELPGFKNIFSSLSPSSTDASPSPSSSSTSSPLLFSPLPPTSGISCGASLSRALSGIFEACMSAPSTSADPPVLMAVGNKNVGKSTALRILLSRLALAGTPVAFLECDIGQSEFTAPGMVSLNLVESPIFGPPYTHQQPPLTAAYFGATSPRENPNYFVSCVDFVYQHYVQHLKPRGIPLLVNSFGWVKGAGFDLLVSIASLVCPTDMMLMVSCGPKSVDPSFGSSGFFGPDGTIHTPRIHTVHTEENNLSSSLRFGPADLRTLALVASFHRPGGDTGPLSTRIPLALPFSAAAVRFLHCEVGPSEALVALNASLVALCVDPQYCGNTADNTDHVVPAVAMPPSLGRGAPLRCVGVGIVRAIDVERRLFAIVTALSGRELAAAGVNTLVRGNALEIPVALFMDRSAATAGGPYVSFIEEEGAGSGARRPRHNMNKRKPH